MGNWGLRGQLGVENPPKSRIENEKQKEGGFSPNYKSCRFIEKKRVFIVGFGETSLDLFFLDREGWGRTSPPPSS